jgi:hypothetical protein
MRNFFSLTGTLLSLAALASCHGVDAVATNSDGTLFWALRMNIPAATMDTGSTLQLSAVALYSSGDTIRSGIPAPTFRSLDPTRVTVSPTGVITAIKPTSTPIGVVASVTADNLTNADTTLVAVTLDHNTVDSIAITTTSGSVERDGKTWTIPVGETVILGATAQGPGGTVSGVSVKYQSLDDIIGIVRGTQLTANARGTTQVVAMTTSYGVALTDTITIVVSNPMTGRFSVNPTASRFGLPVLSPTLIIIGEGGIITWRYASRTGTESVTFLNDVDKIPDGDIPSLPPSPGSVTRQFPTVGSYKFQIAAGDTARVIVIPND